MKHGDKIKGDCENCFNNVKLSFCYRYRNVNVFTCDKCGCYNHKEIK